jgi:hypothetical protein
MLRHKQPHRASRIMRSTALPIRHQPDQSPLLMLKEILRADLFIVFHDQTGADDRHQLRCRPTQSERSVCLFTCTYLMELAFNPLNVSFQSIPNIAPHSLLLDSCASSSSYLNTTTLTFPVTIATPPIKIQGEFHQITFLQSG